MKLRAIKKRWGMVCRRLYRIILDCGDHDGAAGRYALRYQCGRGDTFRGTGYRKRHKGEPLGEFLRRQSIDALMDVLG